MKRMFRTWGYVCAIGVVLSHVCSAAYSITNPPDGSMRGKMDTVAGTGNGPTDEAAVFKFGVWTSSNTWAYSKETAILATAAIPGMNRGPWLKDLACPTDGWKKSPQPMPGMFTGDHKAVVIRVNGAWDAYTEGHIINGS